MLGKLFKYEFKSTARTMLPIYGALIIMAVINRFFYSPGYFGGWSAAAGLSITIYSMIIFATFVVTFVLMIQRFYKNLLGDEGYLMLTLPVKTTSHIISKVCSSIVWIVASVIVTGVSLFIVISGDASMLAEFSFGDIANLFESFQALTGTNLLVFIAEIAIVGLIELISAILMIYASISIGHLVQKHRVITSVVAVIVISTIDSHVSDFILHTIISENTMRQINFVNLSSEYFSALIVFGITGICTAAIYFFITNYVLTKKLNLE